MPERLIVWIIQVSVTGGFSIIVFGVLSWIFRKKYRAGSRKKGWILIAVCLLFPLNMNILPSVQTVEIPAFYMTDYKGSMPVGNNAPGVMQDINGSVQGIQGMEDKVPDMPENGAVVLDNFPTGRVLFIIWSVGVMFLTAYYVTAYRRMYRKVKRWSHDCKDSVLLKMASDIGVEIGLKIMPQIRIMESSSNGPFTMGVLKVNVCVPQSVSSEKELYYVLKHELIHCREKDILWKFLFLAVNVVHWFNPLVWLMRRLAGNDIEQACDEDVLKDVSMSGYREYSNVILAWAEHSRQNPLSVGYVAGTVFLKWRLSNIYESKNKQNGKILVAAVGIMLVLFGSVIDIERDGSWEVESFIDETEESQRYVERVEDKASEEVPMESVSDEAMRQNSLSNRTIAEIPGMDLFLTYGQFDWQGYSDISLHYKGQNLPISGTTMADSMFMPLLALLENSSKAAVILIEAEGSGLYLTNIHMVDLEQFSEVPCEDAVEYLDHKINSTVERENGIVNLELPDRILQFDVSGINSPANLYDQVYYGGIVEYHVENDMLCCNVILHIAPGSDLGNIRLEYELIEKEYKVIHMEFQEFSDNQAPYTVMEK